MIIDHPQKFICTTLRPTYLKHKELYNYDGCAEFVADYLTYEPLQVPNDLVNITNSIHNPVMDLYRLLLRV